jgi:predicted permease
VLDIQPAWGRPFNADEDAPTPLPVVILNERFVRRQNLEPASMMGREIELAGRVHTVVGVIGAAHTRPFDADVYRPLGNDARGGGQNLEGLCRLSESATLTTLNGELANLLAAARRERLATDQTRVPYSATTRHDSEFGAFRPQLQTLLAAVLLVLFVAAVNTTGLLLVRASGRRRDIAVRRALGASSQAIARELFVEGLLLAMVAAAIGLLAAPLFVRGLLAVAPAYYTNLGDFTVDWVVVVLAILLCLAVGGFIAIAPLLEALRINVRDALQEEGRAGTAGRRTMWLRHLLIGTQTAVCALLLVGAALLLRTFINLKSVETGITSEGVLTARMSLQGPQFEDRVPLVEYFEEGLRRLQASPAILAAAVGASVPVERALNLPATFPDTREPDRTQIVNWRYVSPQYFDLFGIKTLAGRSLLENDRANMPPVAVVNETFAVQTYGSVRDALGRRIVVFKQPAREVVGVVSNTSGWSLRDPSRPMMFVPLAQVETALMRTAHSFFPPRWIVQSSQDVASARRELAAIIRDLNPTQPFIEIQTMDSLMVNSIAMPRFYLAVLLAFAFVAVSLAAVGIYGVYAYATASRLPEIGVRLALGASPRSILLQVIGRAVRLGTVATVAGLVGAAAVTRVLQSELFGITPTDPLTYTAVGVILIATVFAAALAPAVRAARVDPLVAMRG